MTVGKLQLMVWEHSPTTNTSPSAFILRFYKVRSGLARFEEEDTDHKYIRQIQETRTCHTTSALGASGVTGHDQAAFFILISCSSQTILLIEEISVCRLVSRLHDGSTRVRLGRRPYCANVPPPVSAARGARDVSMLFTCIGAKQNRSGG